MATRCHLDEAFLLKVLRDTVNQQILEKEEVQEDLEKRLEAIWDLSIELEAAQAICHFQGLSIFAEAAERGAFKGRLSEICLGIVANVCTLLTPALDLATTALRALESFDASVALQGLRIACALRLGNDALLEKLLAPWRCADENMAWSWLGCLSFGGLLELEELKAEGKNFGMMKLLSWGAETDRDSESPAPTDERIAKVLVQLGVQQVDGLKEGLPPATFVRLLSEGLVGLKEVLDTNAMVGMIFFEVAGGPYGAEPVVRKGGAVLSILGFLLIPLIWSLPIAVMTAELCSHDPHVGGKIHFVHKSWGPWLGWMNGWFNAVSNVFDVATLPAMSMGYLEVLLGVVLSDDLRWWICFGLVVIVVVTNILGVELVGKVSYFVCIVVCSPPLLLVMLGLPKMGTLPSTRWQEIHWFHFLTSLMWNTSGFDDAGASAAEVTAPQEIYPRALGISVALVTALYVLPLAVGVAVEPETSLWHDGFLATIGARVGGPVLGFSLSCCGFVSSLAQLNALLCTSVREIICLSDQEAQP
ncbi:Probable polyamine transporter At3g13620, partial [Durusdinium trenchii]